MAEAQFQPCLTLVVRDAADPMILVYFETPLRLFLATNHALKQRIGDFLQLLIGGVWVETERFRVFVCSQGDAVAALVEANGVQLGSAGLHNSLLGKRFQTLRSRHEIIAQRYVTLGQVPVVFRVEVAWLEPAHGISRSRLLDAVVNLVLCSRSRLVVRLIEGRQVVHGEHEPSSDNVNRLARAAATRSVEIRRWDISPCWLLRHERLKPFPNVRGTPAYAAVLPNHCSGELPASIALIEGVGRDSKQRRELGRADQCQRIEPCEEGSEVGVAFVRICAHVFVLRRLTDERILSNVNRINMRPFLRGSLMDHIGSVGEQLTPAKQAQISVLNKILLTSRGRAAYLERELAIAFPHPISGTLPNGDRFRKLLNPNRSPMLRASFVNVVRRARERGWLTDRDVFELGLREAIPGGEHPAEMFVRWDEANEIFTKGVERMSAGLLPLTSAGKQGGTTRCPRDHAEALQGYEAWRNEIRSLGCWVAKASDWMDWYESTYHPDVGGRSIFVNDSSDGSSCSGHGEWDDEAPPHEIVDEDEWLPDYHALVVKELILVCDGDQPYSRHPEPLDRPVLVRAERLRLQEEQEWREFNRAIEHRRNRGR